MATTTTNTQAAQAKPVQKHTSSTAKSAGRPVDRSLVETYSQKWRMSDELEALNTIRTGGTLRGSRL